MSLRKCQEIPSVGESMRYHVSDVFVTLSQVYCLPAEGLEPTHSCEYQILSLAVKSQ